MNLTSLAKEKGITEVATRISAEARDTRNRFWGARRARLVNTATTTNTFPTTVPRMMTVTSKTIAVDAHLECGGAGYCGEEGAVWLKPSKEEFCTDTVVMKGGPAAVMSILAIPSRLIST